MLDLSKIEAGRLELSLTDFSLSKLVGELSTMFAMRCKQKGIDWKVEWEVERAASPFPESRASSLLVQSRTGPIASDEHGSPVQAEGEEE